MKKYVIVGVGGRSRMFTEALFEKFNTAAELCAICDNNAGRLEWAKKHLARKYPNIQSYTAEQFDQMIADYNPDKVIVTTPDAMHDEYICRSMEAGCDVITEKPMTTDEKKCQRIVNTVQKTGRSVRVTFNYRYSPPRTQIKRLLMEGVIGKVLSVEFQWLLDTTHGADYFRRWHSYKQNSGGLMVHKATHHFDLVNWWLSSYPQTVSAMGGRVFYNSKQAKRYGLENHSKRCLDCPVKDKCNFYLDMSAFEEISELYLDCEKYDGYERDRCVFREDIDIEDTMNVTVKYNNGVFMSYSLNAFTPWEGYRVCFNGTKGRLEQMCHESSYVSGDGSTHHEYQPAESSIVVYPHFKEPYQVPIDEGKGAHGGGDDIMLDEIFNGAKDDPYLRCADYVQGAYSILTGIAANKSMATGKIINVGKLVSGLTEPVFPQMPGENENIPYVPNVSRMSGGKVADANVPLKIDAPE
jgi:predicted dehydrogenase